MISNNINNLNYNFTEDDLQNGWHKVFTCKNGQLALKEAGKRYLIDQATDEVSVVDKGLFFGAIPILIENGEYVPTRSQLLQETKLIRTITETAKIFINYISTHPEMKPADAAVECRKHVDNILYADLPPLMDKDGDIVGSPKEKIKTLKNRFITKIVNGFNQIKKLFFKFLKFAFG